MKKFISLLSTVGMLIVALAGCSDKTNSSPTPSVDKCTGKTKTVDSITWSGIDDATVRQGKMFDTKKNVEIVNTIAGTPLEVSMMPNITITASHGTVDTSGRLVTYEISVGTKVTITYTVNTEKLLSNCYVVQEGLDLYKTRVITITEPSNNMVENGDLEDPVRSDNSVPGWFSYKASGGADDYGIWALEEEEGNHFLTLDVTRLSAESYMPRLNTDERDTESGMLMQHGKKYQVTFRAKSQSDRPLYLQVGEIISGAPYFTQFAKKTFQITTTWETYKVTFLMEEVTNSRGHLVFECGTVGGVWVPGKVYLDDVNVVEYTGEGLPNEEPPVFTGVKYTYVETKASGNFDVLSGVTAKDAKDKNLTSAIQIISITKKDGTGITTIPLSDVGTYFVTYKVTDEDNNFTELKRRIDILPVGAAIPNLFGTPGTDAVMGTQADAYMSLLGKFVVWADTGGNAESGAKISFNTATKYEGGTLTVDYSTTTTTAHSYAVQLFYKSPEVSDGGTYHVSFVINSKVETFMQINGKQFDIHVGDNPIDYDVSGRAMTISIQFGGDYASMILCPGNVYTFSNFVLR